MISAKELRIGNILMKDGIQVTIDARSIFDIWDKSDKYSPIPLTPEILERVGFEKTTHKLNEFNIIYYDYRQGNWVLSVITTGVEVEFAPSFETIEDRQHICTIHYLHQLQNLYFALTGIDLNPLLTNGK